MKTETSKRIVNGSIGVSKEAAAAFSEFCRVAGYRISAAAEQAFTEWMAKRSKEVRK